jgi:cytoskeletal protein RodZ
MVNSVGKKLQQSRMSKQLSIEEAARVTRIRPDKLLDLEEDNYSNFPSMSYAKGFLLLYARFLGVDVREFAESIHAPNPVSSDDYEYLNAAAESPPPPPSRRPYYFAARREHTILPVIVFAFLIGAVVLAIYLVVNFQRLGGNLEDIADKRDLSAPAAASPAISTIPAGPAAAEPVPVASAVPVARPVAVAPAPLLRSAPPVIVTDTPAAPVVPAAAAASAPPLPPAAATFDPSREVRRAEPVLTPPDHASASPSPVLPPVGSPPGGDLTLISPGAAPAAPDAVKHVSILPVRKTMVTIRKDVADSAPIFEDWLYPGAGPLKVSGHKFWIEVQDPGAVQVTQDGQPIGAGQSDIQIE